MIRSFRRSGEPTLEGEKPLSAHAEPVWAVAFFSDGRRALLGSDDKTVKVWDVDSGSEILRVRGTHRLGQRRGLLPDGRAAFSASVDKTIKRWDVTADTEVPVFAGHGDAVRHVVFSPDDRTALAAGDNKTLRLVDVATMMELPASRAIQRR